MSLRVYKVKTLASGAHEILYDGTGNDFEYISGRLKMEEDVETMERESPDDILSCMLARGSTKNPLRRERVIQILYEDPEIEMVEFSEQ